MWFIVPPLFHSLTFSHNSSHSLPISTCVVVKQRKEWRVTACVYGHANVYGCVCECVRLDPCIYAFGLVYVRLCIRVRVYVHVMCRRMNMCVCIYKYVSVCMCMCVCGSVVYRRRRQTRPLNVQTTARPSVHFVKCTNDRKQRLNVLCRRLTTTHAQFHSATGNKGREPADNC